MTAIDQITAAASNGLTRAEVIATVLGGRAFTPAEQSAYDKARGIWKLREAKRKAEKKAAGPMSSAERVRIHHDRANSIDDLLTAARERIDWTRRHRAEKSLAAWIKTYGLGVFIDDPPPPRGEEILSEIEASVGDSSRPYQILMSRGFGKTSYIEGGVAFAIATGRRRYAVVVSFAEDSAKDIVGDIIRLFTAEPFATDYPNISVPIAHKNGSSKRRQTFHSADTQLSWNAKRIWLPVLDDDSASGGAILATGFQAGIRGKKRGTLRPDLVILDDLQSRETAANPETVGKGLKIIRGDIMNLGGKGKLACLMTATPIEPDDLAEQIASDRAWKTTRFAAFIHWPTDFENDADGGLWAQYFAAFDRENAAEKPHTKSRAFYRANRAAMDAGAEVLNPRRFKQSDGHLSAIHALMDKMHEIGRPAFDAEYQMKPHREETAVRISPQLILSRVRRATAPGFIPDGSVFVCAATDINPSYAITTSILAFDIQRTAFVTHYHIRKCSIPDALNDTLFDQLVFRELAATATEIAALGIHLDAWGIDAGGKQFKTVCRFVETDSALPAGVKPTAMLGRAGNNWNPNVRSRIREAKNDTVLCRDPERRRWLAWNADAFKESAQKAWSAEVGSPGGLSLFDGNADHFEFAAQIANEQLKSKVALRGDRFVYNWRSRDPHDFGDTVAMCYALAAAEGITGQGEFHRATKKVTIGGLHSRPFNHAPDISQPPRPRISIGRA